MRSWFRWPNGKAVVSTLAAAGMLFTTLGAALAAPGVTPSSVSVTAQPGDSFGPITKKVETSAIPPNPAIVFLSDTTGSMGGAIGNVQSNVGTIVSTVLSSQPTAQFAVAEYKDGDPASCSSDPFSFKLDQSFAGNANGVSAWAAGGGCDAAESGLHGLGQVAGLAFPAGTTTKIVVIMGDAPSHDPDPAGADPSKCCDIGTTEAGATAALTSAGIEVIAVCVGGCTSKPSGGLDGFGQATRVVNATGGTLVTALNSSDVSNAILAGLSNLPVTVTHTETCDPGLSVSLTPASQTGTSGSTFTFTENGSVSTTASSPTLSCTVKFLVNGSDAGAAFTETITVSVQVPTTLTYTGDSTSDYHDAATVSAKLTNSVTSGPIAGQSVTFTLNGAETCTGTTNAGGVASCSITPQEAAGVYPLVASFAGSGNVLPSSTTANFTVTKEETTTTYTGPSVVANGYAATLSGVLKEDGTTAIAGRTLTLTLGSGSSAQSCTGATNAAGTASCTIATVNQPLGPGTATAAFAGDTFYLPSSDTKPTMLFAFPTANGGTFVVGDKSAAGAVNFWGSQWAKNNSLTAGAAPNAFKGFAGFPSSNPPGCGGTWKTDPGNSTPPPAGPLPSYMGVIVSSSISQNGSTIGGNTVRIIVVKTDPGYAGNPGHEGTGTVVASFCP